MSAALGALHDQIRACRLCAAHVPEPRPVLRPSATARLLIAGQAPGTRVHASGVPFTDPSGDRLRAWMGVDKDVFYDTARIAIVPMGFCFPGLDAKGGDKPPRPECARAWRHKLFALMPQVELTLLVGAYAQAWHLRGRAKGASPKPCGPGPTTRPPSYRCRIPPGGIRHGLRKSVVRVGPAAGIAAVRCGADLRRADLSATPPLRVLALCGSLRAISTNKALLQAAQRLAPEDGHRLFRRARHDSGLQPRR